MSRRVVGVTLDNLDDLPKKCRGCVFWELAPQVREQAEDFGHSSIEKEAWISSVLLEWGSCGRILYVDGVPAGYALYAPPSAVPGSAAFPSGPVSADAILLTALRTLPEHAERGHARLLLQHVVNDLTGRGVEAVEAFGDLHETARSCVVPAGFLQKAGFKTVHHHPRWPRLRLELPTASSWKEDVEAALDRLLGSISVRTAEPVLSR